MSSSILIGIVANAVSPKGIALIRDDSNRYAIDTANVKKGSDLNKRGKLNKAGFYEPVNISVETAKQLFEKNVKFVDGRDANEYKEGHIKGAANIPYKEFKEKTIEDKLGIMKDMDKDKMIVSYCSSDSCEMSIDNAYEMAKAGYNDVKIYLGGYKEWTRLGYPTEK
ncbi:MAG: rhodanese-like domain-containing protein [bacterium]